MLIKNVLIIEDEKPNADRLKRLLSELRPHSVVLSVQDTVAGSIEWLENNECPDIIIMDIRLADGLSFEIFNQVRVDCPVIFTTAYDEFAVQAFKYNSIDYLLKPVETGELNNALTKYENLMLHLQGPNPAIENLLNYIKPKDFRTRFLLPYRDGFKTVQVSDVSFFYSENKITHAKLNTGDIEILPQTMEELEQQLNPKYFFRANRQYILHIDSIERIHNYFNVKLKIEIRKNPDVQVIISREKAPLFKAWMDS